MFYSDLITDSGLCCTRH